MKKIFSVFVLIFALFFISFSNVCAESYSESEIIDIIKETEFNSVNATVLFGNWSKAYVSSVDIIIDKEFVNKLNLSDLETSIDMIVNELRKNNQDYAANELSAIKNDLVYCYDVVFKNLDIIENYLISNQSHNFIENSEIFLALKKNMSSLKPYIEELADLYYNYFYDSFKEKLKGYNKVSEIVGLYKEGLEKISAMKNLFNKFEGNIDNWQNIYNLYNLSDFKGLFNDYFGNIYSKIGSEYNKVYKNLEDKMQENLDQKIDNIVENTDLNNYDSVINRNTALYDIIDYIDKIKDEITNNLDEVSVKIKIQELLEKLNTQKGKIIDRFVKAMEYTEEYVIQTASIILKNEDDKKYINIDSLTKLIVYSQNDLDVTKFLNRLFTSFGNIKAENTYSNKIGTLSKIRLYYNEKIVEDYTVIVKGDIAPNGNFDITDIVRICNKMFNKINFNQIENIAADMNNDGKIDITDVVMLCNLLFK